MASQVGTWYLRRTHCISDHATFYIQRTQYETYVSYVCVKRPSVLGSVNRDVFVSKDTMFVSKDLVFVSKDLVC